MCLISVCGPSPTPAHCRLFTPDLTPPLLFAAVSCDPDEPASWFAHMEEAGFQKVPEDDSTTSTRSRVSCLQGLHWDKVDFSAVRFCSQLHLGVTYSKSLHETQILIFMIDYQRPFLFIFFLFSLLLLLFFFLFFWFLFFFRSLMVQTDSSLLFPPFFALWYSFLVFLSPWILSLL